MRGIPGRPAATPRPGLSLTGQVAGGGRRGRRGAFEAGGAAGREAQGGLSNTAQQHQGGQRRPQGRLRRETRWSLREEEGTQVVSGWREPRQGWGRRDQSGASSWVGRVGKGLGWSLREPRGEIT